MLEFLLVVGFPLALVGLSARVTREGHGLRRIALASVFGYALRLVLNVSVMREVAFFSHGTAGGDCMLYEQLGNFLARYWEHTGIHFVSNKEWPELANAALQCNINALVVYINGEPSLLACTSVVAFVAGATCLMVYDFARELGAREESAERLFLLLLFGPSFLYHTSDVYKDGLVAFLVISSLYSSVMLRKKVRPLGVLWLALSFWGLWHVRYYMVFMCLPPILMGLFGVGSGRVPKILWCALFILFGALGWVAFRGGFQEAANIGAEALELGTSKIARDYNARSGSGVQFDSDSGLSTAVLKLVYTLFAPFPWQEGSIGLQLGKVEALLCYYFYFHGLLGIRKSAATNRNSVLVLLLFIVPATIAYSASMANVGLMVRQRMPIVMVFGLLASLSPTMARRRVRDMDPPKEKNPRFPRRGLSPHFG